MNNQFKLPRYKELPAFGLYMDQTLEVINTALSDVNSWDQCLTKTMINNYVKLGYLEKSENKKYNKNHIAKLIVFSAFKSIALMERISKDIFPTTTWTEDGDAFDYFCDCIENSLIGICSPDDNSEKKLLIKTAANTFAEKVKLERLLLLEDKKQKEASKENNKMKKIAEEE